MKYKLLATMFLMFAVHLPPKTWKFSTRQPAELVLTICLVTVSTFSEKPT